MITLFTAKRFYPLADIKTELKEHLLSLPKIFTPSGKPEIVLRFEFPTENINFFSWLHNQKCHEKLYWSDREQEFEIAGVGVADIIANSSPTNIEEVFSAVENRIIGDNERIRYYGGFRFSANKQSPEWRPLGAYRFILPRFEFCLEKNKTVFVLNILAADINEEKIGPIIDFLNTINFENDTHYRQPPQVLSRRDTPTKEEWKKIFNLAMSDINQSKLQKIVLARKSIFNFDKAIDPIALLKHLKDITPNSFHFCLQYAPYQGFLGATPERLFKIQDNDIESEAIAGTSERGKTKEEDANLEKELLSNKNTAEHRFVINHIQKILSENTQNLQADKNPQLLKLTNHQHLLTRFKATANQHTEAKILLKELHPTPAVAGYPTQEAINLIEKLEPFDRGWYAGPIGYIGRYYSEFAVAIRSALIDKENLSLYAGAGIIDQSDCDKEWDEIENKISNFIKVFYQA